MKKIKRPSYASVVSTLALFIALGGTASAATYVISQSSQIKNGAIRNADVRKGTLKADRLSASARAQLRTGTGPRGDVGPLGDAGSRGPQGLRGVEGPQGDTGAQGETGARGEQGAPGPQGKPGPTGEAGPKGDVGPQGETGPQAPIEVMIVDGGYQGGEAGAMCPEGTTVIGGGADGQWGYPPLSSMPYVQGDRSGWRVGASSAGVFVHGAAICAKGVKLITQAP